MSLPSPRIFCIPAARAPIVAVLRRGPTDWVHVGRWDVELAEYEPGSWMRATVYPQRCDLSPDGRWFCYFTYRHSRLQDAWRAGRTYIAISRLPWFTALAAWATDGTWTRGLHFTESRRTWEVGAPEEGDAAPCQRRHGLAVTRPASFAVERRRGWTETPDSPPRVPDDMWELERVRHVTMQKPRPGPGGSPVLTVRGAHAALRESPQFSTELAYALVDGERTMPLEDAQWADWTSDGRLMVATKPGSLQVRRHSGDEILWQADLQGLAPAPSPPPAEAHRW